MLHLDRPGFRLSVAPICPLIEVGYEDFAQLIVDAAIERARRHGSAFVQLYLAASDTPGAHGLLPASALKSVSRARPGAVFINAAAHTEVLQVDLPTGLTEDKWRERMLATFSKNHRRSIRRAERAGLHARVATKTSDLRDAYAVICENARIRGYPVRSWEQFGPKMTAQVASGRGLVITAWDGPDLVGAYYGVRTGRQLTYRLGGVLPRGRDLSAGFFLQWKAMQAARDMGLTVYDLGSPTSESVGRFKRGFGARLVELVEPRYVVFSRARFRLFTLAYPLVTRHRRHALRAMRAFARRREGVAAGALPLMHWMPAFDALPIAL